MILAPPAAEQPAARAAPRLTVWPEQWLALAVLLALGAADLVLIRVGLDAQDEGYFIEQASRVLHGQVPYRDFDSLYTPGLLYLHASLFHLVGGPDVLSVRAVGFLARVVLAGGLYALCRPLVRPLVAVLPAAYVLVALDRVPVTWEPHPGWPAATLSVLCVLAGTRLPGLRGRRRAGWLIGMGGLVALVFALKQNVGVFVGLALVVWTAWQDVSGRTSDERTSDEPTSDGRRAAVTPALRTVQVGLLVGLLLAVAWLIRPHATPLLAAYFLVPIAAVGFAALRSCSVSRHGRGLLAWFGTLVWLGLGFGILTLPWLAALIWALDGRVDLLLGFIGAVNQDILWRPPDWPPNGSWASLFGCAVAVLGIVRARQSRGLAALAALALPVFAVCGVLLTAEPGEATWRALLLAPGRMATGVSIVLPLAGILLGVAWCLRYPRAHGVVGLRWLTIASALMLLAEYPRVDEVHLAWSAAPALATGAVVFEPLCAKLARRWSLQGWRRGVVPGTVCVLAAATALTNLGMRTDGFLKLSPAPLVRVGDVPLANEVLITQNQAAGLAAAARYVQANTAPGEAIFVYPSSPLLYVMADRPNPTRFGHLYPGAASADELNQIMDTLQQLPVRVVVVSVPAMLFWGPPAGNQPLEDVLASTYRQVARFGAYRILLRG